MSEDGQKIVSSNGCIEIANSGAFKSSGATGKIVIAGSSSVTPVMEKLTEAYKAVNSGADIELQESDSTTGITAAADGTCDIGMASRELKDSDTIHCDYSSCKSFTCLAILQFSGCHTDIICNSCYGEINRGI